MKQYLFALAGVVAVTALATDPTPRTGDISLVGFENYTVDQGVAGLDDSGTATQSSPWSGTGEATVRAYGSGAAPSANLPPPFEDSGDKYLEIDSGSDEVQRNIQGATGDNVYIDTLAQFSVLRAGETAPTADNAKILIWLQEDNDNGTYTTNLYAKGGFFNDVTQPVEHTYKLGKSCQPGVWYRVTIQWYKTIMNEFYRTDGEDPDTNDHPGFVIQIDGVDVAIDAEDEIMSPATLQGLCPSITGGDADEDSMDAGILTLVQANKLIPAMGTAVASSSVTQVAFKGNGAIDNFVVSANDPASFILSWPTNLTKVSYVLGQVGQDPPTSPTKAKGFVAITAAEGTPVTLFGSAGYLTNTVSGTVTAGGELALPPMGIEYFFPQTATPGQDGSAEHPYEIDSENALKALQAAVAAGYGNTSNYVQTADITLTAPWPGIGLPNGKDVYSTTEFNDAAFCGVYDGQNHTISGFQMVGVADNPAGGNEGLDYCGFFNSTYNATIKNLKIEYAGGLFAADTSASTKESGATFVGVAKNSLLQNLTTVAGTVSCSKGFGGICGYTTSGTVIDSCTNNVNMTSLANNKCGGIAMITQGGSAVTITNCQNNGTQTTGSSNSEFGGIVGYVGLDTTIADCETTVGRFLKHQGNTVTMQGVNKGDATVLAYHGAATPGLNFAMVDNGVATFVADNALAAGNTYTVMGPSATATYEFTAPGSISFDTALATPTYAITSSGAAGIPTASTSGTVTTYTAGYFPRTATAGQDGSAANPFEIADLDDLEALQAAVANAPATYAGLSYIQTADIALTNVWEGIGVKGGKDIVSQATYDNGAFTGVYDGDNYTISNFQMESGTDYGALFNSVYNATIKNLKISYKESKLTPTADSNDDSTGATFVGVAKSSTLQNLTALAGSVTTVSAYKDFGGIVGYLMAGSTVDSCTNELNVASIKGGRKCGGIAIITQGGSGTATIRNCKNSGTSAGGAQDGGIVGYIGVATLIDGCENTADAPLLTCQSGTVTVSGGTKSVANRAAFVKNGGTVIGLNFATVDGNVATFVADNALALNGEYKVMASGATATYAFAEAGTIAFDTALYTPTYAITAAEGLTLTDATVGTVKTYTATAPAPAAEYKVEIGGADVVITPSDDVLAALETAGIDTSDVSAVNEALAATIRGTDIPVWQALFLGLATSEAGLEAFAIKSIDIAANGNVTLTIADDVALQTGCGVDITLNVLGSDTPAFTTSTVVASATNTKTIPAITPAANETAKFYKVIATFAATPAP